MKYVICKYRRYCRGDILESTTEVESTDTILGMIPRRILDANAEFVESIQRVLVGHHFIDDDIYTYQIVIKRI